jgi:lactoylglutathione lyase
MRFLWTSQFVQDLDRSISFYTTVVDLKVIRRFPAGPQREIAFLGNGEEGETLVELLTEKGRVLDTPGKDLSIGFAVASVDGMLEKVKGLGLPVDGDLVETPAMRYFCVKDPDGLLVQFFQQK